jgi:hypothetical protein
LHRGWRSAHGIEQLGAGEEHHAGAGDRQSPATPTGVGFEIMAPALDRSQGDCVNHQPRFPAGLDHEQPADFAKHIRHPDSLSTERANGGIAPFVH